HAASTGRGATRSCRGRWRSSGASWSCCPTRYTTGWRRRRGASRERARSDRSFLAALLRVRVNVVHPENLFGVFDGGNVEVHDDRLLAAAQQDALERLVGAAVHFLVGDEGRHPDEIAWP